MGARVYYSSHSAGAGGSSAMNKKGVILLTSVIVLSILIITHIYTNSQQMQEEYEKAHHLVSTELTRSRHALRDLEGRYKKEVEGHKAAVNETAELRTNIFKLEKHIREQKLRKDALDKRESELSAERDRVAKELLDVKKELEDEHKSLQEERRVHALDKEEFEGIKKDYQKEALEKEATLDDMGHTLDEDIKELTKIRAELEDKNDEINRLKKQIEQKEAELKGKQSSHEKEVANFELREKHLQEKERQLDDMQTALEAESKQLDEHRATLEAESRQLDERKSAIESAASTLKSQPNAEEPAAAPAPSSSSVDSSTPAAQPEPHVQRPAQQAERSESVNEEPAAPKQQAPAPAAAAAHPYDSIPDAPPLHEQPAPDLGPDDAAAAPNAQPPSAGTTADDRAAVNGADAGASTKELPSAAEFAAREHPEEEGFEEFGAFGNDREHTPPAPVVAPDEGPGVNAARDPAEPVDIAGTATQQAPSVAANEFQAPPVTADDPAEEFLRNQGSQQPPAATVRREMDDTPVNIAADPGDPAVAFQRSRDEQQQQAPAVIDDFHRPSEGERRGSAPNAREAVPAIVDPAEGAPRPPPQDDLQFHAPAAEDEPSQQQQSAADEPAAAGMQDNAHAVPPPPEDARVGLDDTVVNIADFPDNDASPGNSPQQRDGNTESGARVAPPAVPPAQRTAGTQQQAHRAPSGQGAQRPLDRPANGVHHGDEAFLEPGASVEQEFQ